MELKRLGSNITLGLQFSSNRTFMELKRNTDVNLKKRYFLCSLQSSEW